MRELTLLRRENGVPVENLLAIVLKADSYFAKWRHSVKVTTLLDQGNIALITSGFILHNTVHLSVYICAHFFVLVVIYINLGRVRLYHFIHLPNCRITVLAKVPGFCPCVVST